VDSKKHKAFGLLLMGIRFSSLMKLVFSHGIGVRPLYILRLLVLIPTSILSEIFTVIEKLKYGRDIKKTVIEKPPVFIIGHWRSGTTFLHQLLFLDSQFTAPTVVQTVIPEHFLFSSKYWIPVLRKTMPGKRPMDEVEMDPLAPQEDEWALLRLGAPSPMLKVFFPSRKKGFFTGTGEFIPSGKDLLKWKRSILFFLKKITLQTHKRVILKNPYHTPRISLLSEIFPGAKFILIVRHPYKIVPSAINMWNIVAGENAFRGGWKGPSTEETAREVEDFRGSVNENKTKLPEGAFSEVRYEDLEKDPVGEIRRIYSELGFSFSQEHADSILRFMEEKKNYRKNLFNLSQEERDVINRILGDYMHNYGY